VDLSLRPLHYNISRTDPKINACDGHAFIAKNIAILFFCSAQIDLQTEEAKESEGKMLPAKTKAVRSRESSARGAKTVEVIAL